jgi:hypothetical protein
MNFGLSLLGVEVSSPVTRSVVLPTTHLTKKEKSMNNKKLAGLLVLALTLVIGLVVFNGGEPKARAAGTCSVPSVSYPTIQSAASDSACTEIDVAAGAYNENVVVNFPTTIKGAQAGQPVAGRTSGGLSESTVNGANPVGTPVFKITATDVTIDGFTVKNSITTNAAIGIDVKNTATGATIKNNIIDAITTADTGGNGTAQGVYLEAGPDNTIIQDNEIKNVHGNRSTKGIHIGDAGSSNPSQNVLIKGNSIHNITSDTKGAYGVSINNGNGGTSNSGLQVLDNSITNLSGGGWTHAIGLEANTPGVIVTGNSVSNIVAPSDAVAVWFEVNPSFGAAQVHQNNLDVTIAYYGIAVQPPLAAAFPSLSVNGNCNWWGSVDGPGPVGPGNGARVSPGVTFDPWLIAPAPSGPCGATRKECEKFYEQQKKDFHDQQEADKKGFEAQQKADKETFEATSHTPAEKKAFHDQQEADKKTFHDQQEDAKKAFEEQNKTNKEQCKSLPK